MSIFDILQKRPLVLDGAMGTTLMAKKLGPEIFGAHPGCFDYLVESAPEAIAGVHEEFLAAGADIIETDSFSATPSGLLEHGLDKRCAELNETAALLSRKCTEKFRARDGAPRFVAGSIGPGAKLATLGQISYKTLYTDYREQISGLLSGGVDLLQIETCQDLLQIKAAVAAARAEMDKSREVPIYVSVTLEKNGQLLTGPDVAAIASILAPLEIDFLGFNCGNGPAALAPYLEQLQKLWPRHIGFYPNAGLPQTTAAGLKYPESPQEMAAAIAKVMDQVPLSIIGGCCGTSPAHIRAIAEMVKARPAGYNRHEIQPTLSSLYRTLEINCGGPFLFAERTNATGSKAFRNTLLENNLNGATDIILAQEQNGADAIDLSVAYTGLNEVHLLQELAGRAGRECRLPLVLDSTNVTALEAALQNYGGRALINSVNLEDGGQKARQILLLAKKYGAMVVALTIDEQGMAKTREHKLAVAGRLITLCREYGLPARDIFVDFLTFTLASGEESLQNSAVETLAAIGKLKEIEPAAHTILGLSNISFGLAARSRPALNALFLAEAAKAGLTAAIINPASLPAVDSLPEKVKSCGLDLIYHRQQNGDPLERYIKLFTEISLDKSQNISAALSPAEAIRAAVLKGRADLLAEMPKLLEQMAAEEILSTILLPAMAEVGDLMAAGKLQLPFVLKSAQVMSQASEQLKGHFTSQSGQNGPKFVLATVRGDVHDIGKNLVKMILSNNGITVIDLGIKVPVETVVDAIKEHRPAAVGLSGLLVSSAEAMKDYMAAFAAAGFTLPVLVGGAALTPSFTKEVLAPAYPGGQVFYCKDAFDDLNHLK